MKNIKKIVARLLLTCTLAGIIIGMQSSFYDNPTSEDIESFRIYVDSEFFAIVNEVERTDREHLNPLEVGFLSRSLRVRYTNIKFPYENYFITSIDYQSSISIGDTISKRKGDTTFCIRKIKLLPDGRRFACFDQL